MDELVATSLDQNFVPVTDDRGSSWDRHAQEHHPLLF
jgi:hypothetical protein